MDKRKFVIIALMEISLILTVITMNFLLFLILLSAYALILVMLIHPPALIYFAILISSLHTTLIFVYFNIGNTSVTSAGLLWPFLLLVMGIYLAMGVKTIRIPKYLTVFIILSIWVIVRYVISPTGVIGIKDVLWYSYPLLVSLFIHNYYANQSSDRILQASEKMFMVILMSWLVPAIIYAYSFIAGLTTFTYRGLEGRLFESRMVSIFLLFPLSMAIANIHYKIRLSVSWFTKIISIAMILGTLSRMASVTAVALVILQNLFKKNKWIFLAILVLGMVISVLAVTQIPVLRDRFFFESDVEMGIIERFKNINTMGRTAFWAATFQSGMESPIFGKGLGTSRMMVAEKFFRPGRFTEFPPLNEYLQAFHDLGIVGLLLLVCAWGGLLIRNWKQWKNETAAHIKRWHMASILSIISILFLAITDNPFHFPSILIMVSIVFTFTEIISGQGEKRQGSQNAQKI
jgi:hypothetical protein